MIMDVPQDKAVRRFVRWLKDKVENRRSRDGEQDPWWVTLMLDVGRPAVAVMILTMCAPGEHYLGMMAGWSRGLAWLTPASLTAYAGISAVVATKRPKAAPGRKTAVSGAILSILIAMAAQPVAHLYEQGLITGHRLVLTIVVSVIPAAVFGHLLHMGAAAPKPVRSRTVRLKTDKGRTADTVRPLPVLDTDTVRPLPVLDTDIAPDTLTAGHVRLSSLIPDSRTVSGPVPSLADRQNLSARALVLASAGQDKEEIKDTLRGEFPDSKPDSVRKAADRALDKVSGAS